MASSVRLRWSEIARADEWCLIGRNDIGRVNPGGYHSHDFSELFWVEEGSGRHRINEQELPLSPGTLCYIRAADRHSLHAVGAQFTIVNVAFRPGLVEEMVERLGGVARLAFDFGSDASSRATLLPGARMDELRAAVQRLASGVRDRFDVELFLLTAMAVGGGSDEVRHRLAPDWLVGAVEKMRAPELFREGVPAMVRLAGRSAEHVARETRRHFGCTPGDLVNRARLEYAAGQLELTPVNITELALDCGFQSLSHFIRLFRKRYGEPPLRYRRRRWGLA